MSERLEGVINKIIKNWNEHDYIDDKSIYFLAKHARRAERYKQALEFYANENNYIHDEWKPLNPNAKPIKMSQVEFDDGEKARQALKGESE